MTATLSRPESINNLAEIKWFIFGRVRFQICFQIQVQFGYDLVQFESIWKRCL